MGAKRVGQCGFHFNARRCTGCRSCVLACKDYHDLAGGVAFRQVYEFVGGGWHEGRAGELEQDCYAYYVSNSCNHCLAPVCVEVCPTGAMHKEDDGLVLVDARRCIGCGYCALACPYRAPKVDRELGRSVKCDGCADRVRGGGRPICVEACPMRALDFGEVEDLAQRYGSCADVPPLPDSSATMPCLVVTPPACVSDDLGEVRALHGAVANRREIVSQM